MISIKVYLDESGHTGCVVKKADFLNFKESPTFALAGIVIEDSQQERIKKKYIEFKKKFNIEDEIKGSDLLIRKNNDKLKYFVENILNDLTVFINIYDKKFYLSTLIMLGFTGQECIEQRKVDFYTQATNLAKQDDEFFVEYLNFVENPTLDAFSKYLKFLTKYDYKYFEGVNIIVMLASIMLNEKTESCYINDFMTYGWYSDKNKINLINLNCLAELIYDIKYHIKEKKLSFIHDNIVEFEDDIQDELTQFDLDIVFQDSKDSVFLQIADNVVSIFRHVYDKGIYYCANNKMWKAESRWDLELFSKIQDIVSEDHIKYTVPICDWSASLSIKEMFSKEYSLERRNTANFNILYRYFLNKINMNLFYDVRTLNDVDNTMNE